MEKKENKLKTFWQKHKGKIIGATAIVTAVSLVVVKIVLTTEETNSEIDEEGKKIIDAFEEAHSLYSGNQAIDEDIFTNLAPNIEDAVLEEGLDEAYFEKNYSVEYPINGNPDEGYYTVNKKVTVSVNDITE